MTPQKSNIPALRFPEFKGEWILENLGSHFTFKNGVNADSEAYGRGHKFINVLDIISDIPLIQDRIIGSVDISDETFKKNEVTYGDILFQRSSETREEVGQSNIYVDTKNNATFGGFVIRGRPITEQIPEYFHYLLKTSKVRKDITSRSGGSTRYNIGQESLSDVSVDIAPTVLEQKKIADFLTAVDQKITQLTEKKSCLERYKKGVMQRLFTQRLRFHDTNGKPFPNWEIKKANDVFENYSNKDHDGTLPIVAVTQENGVVRRDGIGIDIKSSAESILSYKIIEVGDFVISLRSFQGGIEYSNIRGICSPAYTILRPKIKISDDFFKFYFKREDFISRLSETVIGIRDGKQISYSAFSGMKLSFPNVQEQQKIADFLTAIDDKITALGNQLTAAQDFKKSLLQKMFV